MNSAKFFLTVFLVFFGILFHISPAHAYLLPLLGLSSIMGPLLVGIVSVFLVVIFHLSQVLHFLRKRKKDHPSESADKDKTSL